MINGSGKNSLRLYSGSNLAILALFTFVSYSILDIGFRYYTYVNLEKEIRTFVTAQYSAGDESQLTVFDRHVGYRYKPNMKIERGHPWFSTSWTNSYGHLSKDEYPKEKPNNEYRIAVIGDSFTAAINSTVHWPDVLQDRLRNSPEWLTHVDGKDTRIINFGVDGAGFQAFAEIAEHKLPAFNPDLVIVNFISDDILRRKHYRLHPQRDPLSSAQENIEATVHSAMKDLEFDRPFPELLYSATYEVLPRFLSSRMSSPRIPLHFDIARYLAMVQRFSSRDQGVIASAEAVRKINKLYPGQVIYVRDPLRDQLAGVETMWDGLEEDVQLKVAGWSYIDLKPYFMRDYDPTIPAEFGERGMSVFDIFKLPESERPDVFNLFYYPYDDHYRDYGNVKVGEFIHEYLVQKYIDN